jgi:hypothetical protein
MRLHEEHHGPSPHRRRLRFECLESRDLPASHPIGAPFPGLHPPAADVQQFVPLLYPPGTPQPTAAEVERESFVNKATGRYVIGPGRFDTQAITIHGYGKPSSSNLSTKTHFQYVIYEPTDPSKPVTGIMNVLAGNVLNSGASLIIDLQGPTGTEVNGLPTQLFWYHDVSSGSVFTGTGFALPAYANFPANYFNRQGLPANPPPGSPGVPPSSVANWNLGLGDAKFTYIPDAHPIPGTLGSGRVIVVVRGLINNSGAQNPIDKNYQ